MKKMTVLIAAILAVAVILGAAGCGVGQPGMQASNPGAPLTVKVLDVGQGDALLVRTPEQVILIDTGDTPTKERLVGYIKKEGITVIDKLIITHPHADHIGGVQAVFDNFTVKQVYDSGQTTTSNMYKQYLVSVQKKKIPFALLEAGTQLDVGGGVLFKVLSPEKPFIKGTDSDLNNNSIVLKLIYGNFSMLFTGDAEKEAEQRMGKSFAAELKSTVLKAGHHGSSTSSSHGFLKAAEPETVVISLGANNEYHHPHPSVLKRYSQLKLKVFRTDTDGTVTVSSDGKTYSVTKEKP